MKIKHHLPFWIPPAAERTRSAAQIRKTPQHFGVNLRRTIKAMDSRSFGFRPDNAIIIGHVTPSADQQRRQSRCRFAGATTTSQQYPTPIFCSNSRSMEQDRVVASQRVKPVEQEEKRGGLFV